MITSLDSIACMMLFLGIDMMLSWPAGKDGGVNIREQKLILGAPNTLFRPPRLPPCLSRAC